MPIISPALPDNGDEAIVDVYNAAILAILGVLDGNIDASNLASGSIPFSALNPSISNAIPASFMQDSGNLEKFRKEGLAPFVASGMIWSIASGLNGSMTAGVYYDSNGVRNTAALIASHTFTASKDTYIDYPAGGGSPSYTEAANGATAPASTSGYIRIAKVVTGSSAIASVVQSGSDGVGNIIYPKGPVTAAKLQNPALFSVYNNTAFSTSGNTLLPVIFNTVQYDTGSNYSTTTGRFTATAAGYYHFDGAASCATYANDVCYLIFQKNGTNLFNSNAVASSNAAALDPVLVVPPVYLAVGDYVQMAIGHVVSGNMGINGGLNNTYFAGFLISGS